MPRRLFALTTVAGCVVGGLVATSGTAPASSAVATSARCPWVGSTALVSARVAAVVARMTLDEKVSMVHGHSGSSYVGLTPALPELCIPALTFQDGPAGVGDGMTGVTQLPAPVAVAATWDRDASSAYGMVLGREQSGKGTAVTLAPTVNIVRDPRWGRAFESTGEDPYLAGQVGTAMIRGIQGTGQLAQVKHLAVYNQETNRNVPADNAIVSARAMQELYLPAFHSAVRDGAVASAMCSYSYVNGTAACENPYLLTTTLRQQFGFDGFVTSDWWATKSTSAEVNAGLDIEMPGGAYLGAALKVAVLAGRVPLPILDGMVKRILTQMFGFGLFDRAPTGSPTTPVTSAASIARGIAISAEGTVLLKNASSVLPITSAVHSIAVIGDDAADQPRYRGGGSAAVTAAYGVAPLLGIDRRAPRGTIVSFDPGVSPAAAAALAAKADVAVVFASQFETEGADLTSINLPGNLDQVITAVAAANPHTVVVLNTGSAVAMPWVDKVAGVVEAWYPGQDDGTAIAGVLFGDVNPSGHLPVTFPRSLADVPARTTAQWPGVNGTVQYSEGLDVGYRWYDQQGITPLFPFGYGLSYTRFGYSSLAVTGVDAGGLAHVSATVTNTGTRVGADVTQLYVTHPAGTGEPPRVLRGFQRVVLAVGASARITMTLSLADLAVWNSSRSVWTTPTGAYQILVGDSSRTLPLQGALAVAAATPARTVTVNDPGPIDISAHALVSIPLTAHASAGGTVSFAASGLAVGLTLSPAGLLTGSAAMAGTSTVTVTATDNAGAVGTASFVLTVNPVGGAGGPLGTITGLAGLCLDVRNASATDATSVQTFTCNGTNSQQWTARPDHTLRALGKCLDVKAAGTSDRTPVQLYTCNSMPAQQWVRGANASLVNPASGRCLDVPAADSEPGTHVQIFACNGTGAQRWTTPS